MKRNKETIVLIAAVFVVVGIISLILNYSSRYFSEYIYNEIEAWEEEKKVYAMEDKPQESSDEDEDIENDENTKDDENDEINEEEQLVDNTDSDIREDSNHGKPKNDGEYIDNHESSVLSNDNNDENKGEPVITDSPHVANPEQTSIPVYTPETVYTATPGPSTQPTATSKPTATPTTTPASEPTATPELISITASWPDKDRIVYKSDINMSTLTIIGEMSDGSKITIPANKCSVIGLESKSLGEHTMIIKYGSIKTTLSYTIIRGDEYTLGYEWDVTKNKGKFIIGEDLSEILYVYKEYLDGDQDYISDYSITGIDFNKPGKQTGYISCEGMTKAITIEVVEKQYINSIKYYSKSDELIHSESSTVKVGINESTKVIEPDSRVIYDGKEYILLSTEFKVDGVEKTFPYTIKERDILSELNCVYVSAE